CGDSAENHRQELQQSFADEPEIRLHQGSLNSPGHVSALALPSEDPGPSRCIDAGNQHLWNGKGRAGGRAPPWDPAGAGPRGGLVRYTAPSTGEIWVKMYRPLDQLVTGLA